MSLKIPMADSKVLELDFRKVADDIIESEFSGELTRDIAEAVANSLLSGMDVYANAQLAKLNAA